MKRHHYIIASRLRYLRVHLRVHHPRAGAVALRAGVGGEATYHAAELAGWHSGVAFACAVLLLVLIIRVLYGET